MPKKQGKQAALRDVGDTTRNCFSRRGQRLSGSAEGDGGKVLGDEGDGRDGVGTRMREFCFFRMSTREM